jgi:O-methyltransferase involved in polyketide biosynthesis
MSEKISIELGNVQTTLLLPLWGRAVESQKKKPLLIDKMALEIINKIDYDFSTIAKNTRELSQLSWIIRSKRTDNVIKQFLQKHPKATIVNIGCGLDTTFFRIDNGSLHWTDLDLPDVIELRKKFIIENERMKFISSSFLDEGWLKFLPKNETILFLAGGVLYYFDAEQIKTFFKRISDIFPESEICFDATSPYGVTVANKLVIQNSGLDEKSFLKWGLKSIDEITGWDNRIQVLKYEPLFEKSKKGFSLKNIITAIISDHYKIMSWVHLKL